MCGMSPPTLSRGPSVLFVPHLLLLPSVPASGVSKTQASFLGLIVPILGPHPPELLPRLLLWLGVFWGARSYRGVPTLYLREPHCASCHGALPRTWSLPISTQYLPDFSRKNLLELSSWAQCGGAFRFPPEPGAILGHTRTLMSAGPMERSARGHSWDPQTASQSWPSPGKEVELAPKENDGCEQLPSWPGASPPDVPEGSRCVGTLVEVDAAESGQLPV